MIAEAHAKINLSLEVLGRRADGYHEIVSVMQLLALHDILELAPAGTISLRLRAPHEDLPADEDAESSSRSPDDLGGESNLVLQAARLLAADTGTGQGATIALTKRVPVAAGLGGGSADAAATLLALRSLWNVSVSDDHLASLAARLGSDVPFFLDSPTALATGRGEQLRPLPSLHRWHVVLAAPRIVMPDKTRRLYAALNTGDYSEGAATRALAAALAKGESLEPALLVNAFASVALRAFPQLETCRQVLLAAGAPWVRLSGAGPALFTLLPDAHAAAAVAARARETLLHVADVIETATA